MATATRHEETSAQLLSQADQKFQEGHLTQAADKAWEAVAHYVNSVAKARGWPNESHRDLRRNARRLLEFTPNTDDNMRKFIHVNVTHVNYFNDELDTRSVQLAVRDARTLVAAMRKVESKLDEVDGIAPQH